jgi:hypothetical protein
MGHGTRNANRAAGIAKNEARIGKLAGKLKELGDFIKDMKREGMDEMNEIMVVMDEVHEAFTERLRLLERPWWKKVLRMDTEKEEVEMPKKEEKKPEPPATPSHRQVVVDRKVPGPKKREEEPDGTKAESRDN